MFKIYVHKTYSLNKNKQKKCIPKIRLQPKFTPKFAPKFAPKFRCKFRWKKIGENLPKIFHLKRKIYLNFWNVIFTNFRDSGYKSLKPTSVPDRSNTWTTSCFPPRNIHMTTHTHVDNGQTAEVPYLRPRDVLSRLLQNSPWLLGGLDVWTRSASSSVNILGNTQVGSSES